MGLLCSIIGILRSIVENFWHQLPLCSGSITLCLEKHINDFAALIDSPP